MTKNINKLREQQVRFGEPVKGFRRRFVSRALVFLFWLAVWQLVFMAVGNDLLLASPWQVLQRLSRALTELSFWRDTFFSILRMQIGYLIGLIAGVILAVLTQRYDWLNRLLHPFNSAVRSTPVASFIILALIWMTKERVVIFIVFLMVLPIVWQSVGEGIKKTDVHHLEMARVYRLTRTETIRYIYLPSLSPFFITAATTGLGLGWKAGIAAEVLSRPALSLGNRLYQSKLYLETADLITYTLVIIILSLLLEKLWRFVLNKPLYRTRKFKAGKRS